MAINREQLLDAGDTSRQQGEVTPYRIQLNLSAAHMDPNVIEEMMDGLEDDAEARGFNLEWSFVAPMALDEVIPGSVLDLVVRGVDADAESTAWPDGAPKQRETSSD